MSKYRINKLYINNFKLFEEVKIDFSKGDIIILDGPNGFGKTTIFDAIELLLTGKISRMVDVADNRRGCHDIIICNDENEDVLIKVEFESLEDKFTLIKKIDNKNIEYTNMDRRSSELNKLFKTYKVKEFDSEFNDNKEIEQKDVDKLFDIDLSRFYSLFYYIQQEDNTYFLKKNEKERMDTIKYLFDTYKEENELKKLEKAKNKLLRIYKKNYEKKEDIKENIKLKNKNISKIQEADENISYKCLFPELKISKEWDRKRINVESKKKKDKYKRELDAIENFIKYFSEFKKDQFNKKLKLRLEDTKLLKDTIIIANFIDGFDKIKVKYQIQKRLEKYNKILKSKKIEDINKKIDLKKLPKKLKLNVDINNINQKLNSILKYKENSSELSKLVDELNITRSSLKDQFNKITNENNNIINNRCPLCGYGWENYNKLIKQIEKKKKKFIVFCDETMKKVQKEIEELYSNHLEGLISSIDNYLDKEENKINNNFYKQLSSSYNRVDKVKSLIKFCKNQRINLTKHINKKINRTIGNIDEEVEKLKEEIRKRHKIVNEEYYYKRNEDNFDYLYKELFNEKEKNVSNLNIKLIKQKKSYIDYLYYNNVIQEIKNMEENKEKLESKLEKIEDKLKSLKSSIKIYNTCIKEHWGKIIKKVEIPFYIYSGKIIQDYQRGIGIFIKGSEDKEELDSIKFVPNLKTDHDVINYLSSGQLSGLVIAFTLALNKVYGNRKLTTVLIDDPVQTMDDINMACFVEVLRNEFSNKQIIMSTHEDNVSMYMRYKFAKYNLKQVRFNVKERLNDVLG